MDKVQKIREEVERMHNLLPVMDGDNISVNYADRICTTLEMYIDSLQEESVAPKVLKDMLNAKTAAESLDISQEEHDRIVDELIYGKEPELVDVDDLPNKEEGPVSNDFEMALAEMIDKAQKCVVEPWAIAAQWKDELIKLAKSEEPVSEIDFEQELYKAFGHIKDFTLGMRIASRFYEMGRNHQEPVSEDLGEYINELSKQFPEVSFAKLSRIAVRVAKWQEDQLEKNRLAACDRQTQEEAKIELDFVMSIIEKEYRQPTFDDAIKYGMRLQRENMMRKATEVTVHIDAGNYPYIPQIELYDYDKDIPLAKEGDKYKVVLIKEE